MVTKKQFEEVKKKIYLEFKNELSIKGCDCEKWFNNRRDISKRLNKIFNKLKQRKEEWQRIKV